MKNKLIVLFGSGRSGTSWLHLMLGAHPEIVTGQQCRLFERYCLPIYQRYQQEWREAQRDQRVHGLASYLTEEEVIAVIREFARTVFGKVEPLKPGARLTLENQPGDTASPPLIARCFPDVKFIHLIRHPLDVVCSLVLGYQGFQVDDVAAATEWWAKRMKRCLELRELGAGCLDVRFEDLLDKRTTELVRIFDFLNVEIKPEQAEAIYEEFRFENVSQGRHHSPFVNPGPVAACGTSQRNEPRGFFRGGTHGQWRSLMSRGDLQTFLDLTGDLMTKFGYSIPDPKELPRTRRSVVPLRRAIGQRIPWARQLVARFVRRGAAS